MNAGNLFLLIIGIMFSAGCVSPGAQTGGTFEHAEIFSEAQMRRRGDRRLFRRLDHLGSHGDPDPLKPPGGRCLRSGCSGSFRRPPRSRRRGDRRQRVRSRRIPHGPRRAPFSAGPDFRGVCGQRCAESGTAGVHGGDSAEASHRPAGYGDRAGHHRLRHGVVRESA